MFKYGHWESEFEITDIHKQFVYELTLDIDGNEKKYIGCKKIMRNWQSYKSSQDYVKPHQDKITRFLILELHTTEEGGLVGEDHLLEKYNCVKSDYYINKCRKGIEFNVIGRKKSQKEIDDIIARTSKKCSQPDGIIFDSVKYASDKTGIRYSTLINRCKYQYKGWKYVDDPVFNKSLNNVSNTKKCVGPDGIIYSQVGDASIATNIEYQVLKQRCRSKNCGWQYLEQDGAHKKVVFQDKEYESKKDLAQAMSVDITRLNYLINAGLVNVTNINTVKDKKPRGNSKGCISPGGKIFKSLKEASEKENINLNTLKKWCFHNKNGWKYNRSTCSNDKLKGR